MSLLDGILHRLRVLWRGEEYAREQQREQEFHRELEMQSIEHRSDGAVDAEHSARRAFGNVTYYREEARRMSALSWLDRVGQDARYALRGLRSAPGFTVTVVATLALGFGVNAAMYSLLDTLFLRAPEGIVTPAGVRRLYVGWHRADAAGGVYTSDRFEYPHYRAMIRTDASLALALATVPDSTAITVNGARYDVRSSEVTRAYFNVLGLDPLAGRFFAPEEDSVQAPSLVAVISDQLWRTRFNSAPGVVGQRVTIGQRSFTIVGVAPPGFRGIDLDATDLWVPLNTHQTSSYGMQGPWYETFGISARIIARPKNAGDEQRMLAIAANAMHSVRIPYLEFDSRATVLAGPIIAARGPMNPTTEIDVTVRIAAIALIVLAIAVANVINMLLLRAARRQREIALRRALGVSRGRLVGQLAVESTILALLGGAVAVLVAAWSGTALRALVLPRVHWAHVAIAPRTVGFILVLSILVGIAAGVAPAVQGMQADLIDALRAGQRDGSYRRSRLRSALLAMQAAFCVVLLVGAGLFARSLTNVEAIDTGYDVDHVTGFSLEFPNGTGTHEKEARIGIPEAARRMRGVAGVRAVAFAVVSPLDGVSFTPLALPDRDSIPHPPHQWGPTANAISPEFFDAVGMRIVRGRAFTATDGPTAPLVIIVNETMARTIWPGEEALGKCVIVGKRGDPCSTVVGVVADAHRVDVIEAPAMLYYTPLAQPAGGRQATPMTLVVRSFPGQSDRITSLARRELLSTVPSVEAVGIHRLSDAIRRQSRSWRLGATLFGAFSILAFVVAGIGVYSVVAYGVAQRTHEMGIRIALGAPPKQILDLVVADGLRPVIVGVAIGVVTALLLGRLIASLLFGVTPSDPSTFIVATIALCVLGTAGSLVPALRATRVDPIIALRSE
jgi:putative ABC transport system permease protein